MAFILPSIRTDFDIVTQMSGIMGYDSPTNYVDIIGTGSAKYEFHGKYVDVVYNASSHVITITTKKACHIRGYYLQSGATTYQFIDSNYASGATVLSGYYYCLLVAN